MAFVNLNTVEVRGTWVMSDGTPESGTVTFTPSTWLLDVAGRQEIAPTSRQISLDGTGSIAVQLPATNDPDIAPLNWTMHVSVALTGSSRTPTNLEFDMEIPISAAGPGIDLVDRVEVASSTGVFAPSATAGDLLALGEDAWLLVA